MTSEHDEIAPGTRLGPYVVDAMIGMGGMASVHLARHEQLGHRVALKTLHARFATMPSAVERFAQEARAASALRHRHVIEVFDVSIVGPRPYLAMEYLEGETLADRLIREGRMSAEAIVAVVLPVISAVSAAHAAGIIHRDLKPDNIILARDEGGERPVLLDFGISKILDLPVNRALTQVGQVVGTPYYMAPEQIRAEELDGRTDQYALGVMLYECATGTRPFRAEQSVFVLMAEILLGQPLPPRQIDRTIPAAFEAVILRAMAARREDRFASMEALGRALLPFASADVCQQWARVFGASPDDVEPIDASAHGEGDRVSFVPASGPSFRFDPTMATQPALPAPPQSGGEPLHAADLRALPSLADFSDAELEAFGLAAMGRRFSKGAVLFEQGTTGDACFAIVQGAVEVSKDLHGAAMVLDVLGPGAFVGQDVLAERATRSVTARAVEDTLVIELSREQMQRHLGFHDRVTLRLLEQIAVSGIRRLRAGTKQLAKLLEARATERKPDGAEVTATRPLEQLRAAMREWSVRIDER